VLLQLHGVDELRQHGQGRALPWTGALWALGTVGLIGIPYVGVFLGWGPKEDPLLSEQPPEEPVEREAAVPLMVAVTAVAIVLGLVASVVPGLQQRVELGAERFVDRGAYAAHVLHGVREPLPPRPPFDLPSATGSGIAYGFGTLALALAFGALGLWYRRLPGLVLRGLARPLKPPLVALRLVHSGIVGDYVLWIAVGTAVIGGVWGLTLH
jgi:multicomponent Na+:H+ antiporter subunit D